MSIFGGSKSSSNITQVTTNEQQSTTFGDLSHDNMALKNSSYNYNGFKTDDLKNVLNSVNSNYNETLDFADSSLSKILNMVQNNTESTIYSVQTTAAKAIDETGKAYAKASSDTSNFFDSIQPLVFVLAIAAIGVYAVKRR